MYRVIGQDVVYIALCSNFNQGEMKWLKKEMFRMAVTCLPEPMNVQTADTNTQISQKRRYHRALIEPSRHM